MADDAGVAAEQAAPGALAIASTVHDRKQERRNRHTTYKDACTARQQLKDAERNPIPPRFRNKDLRHMSERKRLRRNDVSSIRLAASSPRQVKVQRPKQKITSKTMVGGKGSILNPHFLFLSTTCVVLALLRVKHN